MILPFRLFLICSAIMTGMVTSYTVFAGEIYDRLDGHGPSKKRVDVIEWDGNLELHVYPKGSLKGLAVKLDDREEGKKVMVVEYHLADSEPLVRRAILGVPFNSKLKAFSDPSEAEFDKLAISNQDLKGSWQPYKLLPAPKQWYPDGDPRNGEAEQSAPPLTKQAPVHAPAVAPAVVAEPPREPASHSQPAHAPQHEAPEVLHEDERSDGSVGHFSF